jgi:hypothetical protein
MEIIKVNNLTKEFYISKRKPGLMATFKDLFKKDVRTITAV